ncbi:hypothetical protein J5J10_05795 [Ciceribacter sp. L1K23]|uniref:hypothetical protein n=1 Tax=unclassified Ciceribacter TaxID=2628820 RepID=UPI001ABE7B43|nr:MULTISPECIES: hypothetical protein [unclassified Ciceribacter]MBO3760754.1 hypothetical protein [Ciceribacter sp. L1K22]MBR0555190.1 hypothetical protein [Ciceribacter sp. L1K23]
MNKLAIVAAATLLAGASTAFAIEPIPGSITYGGNVAQLEKAPVGSTVLHTFTNAGKDVNEVYVVAADKTLQLVSRSISND